LTLLENQLNAMGTPSPSAHYARLISQLRAVGKMTSHSMPPVLQLAELEEALHPIPASF